MPNKYLFTTSHIFSRTRMYDKKKQQQQQGLNRSNFHNDTDTVMDEKY